jgi:polyferredoxin
VQTLFLAVCLAAGLRLYGFCQWASGASQTFTARPGAAEGFLPISALLALKRLVLAGAWDPVHPAGLAILLAAIGCAALLRKGFCGHVCPVGLVSDLAAGLGRRLKVDRTPPVLLDRILRVPKYLLLAFFLATALAMDPDSIQAFLTSPFNLAADARMLRFFLAPSSTTLIVLGCLAGLGMVVRNAWCRWLCPYGALLGLAALAGPVAVRRDPAGCTGCGRCERACPSAIRIRRMESVRVPECIGCGQCVGACPEPGVLTVHAAGRPIPWPALALGSAGIVLGAWLAAEGLGLWTSAVPAAMLKAVYAQVLQGM